jgi:hypothetical protein
MVSKFGDAVATVNPENARSNLSHGLGEVLVGLGGQDEAEAPEQAGGHPGASVLASG